VAILSVVRGFTVHDARGHTSARIVNYELAALSPAHLREIADHYGELALRFVGAHR
jgi:hypothetical protein